MATRRNKNNLAQTGYRINQNIGSATTIVEEFFMILAKLSPIFSFILTLLLFSGMAHTSPITFFTKALIGRVLGNAPVILFIIVFVIVWMVFRGVFGKISVLFCEVAYSSWERMNKLEGKMGESVSDMAPDPKSVAKIKEKKDYSRVVVDNYTAPEVLSAMKAYKATNNYFAR